MSKIAEFTKLINLAGAAPTLTSQTSSSSERSEESAKLNAPGTSITIVNLLTPPLTSSSPKNPHPTLPLNRLLSRM
ncbi:MAG: hypothetical protein U9R58_09070 [Chloroflexota bacterium]|nr:hypothetical protein [Chloroflexota bacterium]